jgi:hypothetical protein
VVLGILCGEDADAAEGGWDSEKPIDGEERLPMGNGELRSISSQCQDIGTEMQVLHRLSGPFFPKAVSWWSNHRVLVRLSEGTWSRTGGSASRSSGSGSLLDMSVCEYYSMACVLIFLLGCGHETYV